MNRESVIERAKKDIKSCVLREMLGGVGVFESSLFINTIDSLIELGMNEDEWAHFAANEMKAAMNELEGRRYE